MKDPFGREITYLRLSVTDLCDLRCAYCMPAEGVRKLPHSDMLTEEEMILAVEAAASLGVTKLRITGGEPLVKRNILSICRRAAAVEGIREVCLTTNGIRLPELAKDLRAAGVRRVNMSLDTLDPDRYACITRTGSFANAWKGFLVALEAGFERVRLNAVLLEGTSEKEIRDLAELTRAYPVDVRFIERMPMPGTDAYVFRSADDVPAAVPELVPLPDDGGIAERYALPGAMGYVGLIRPVSACFCANCTRLRLTADGRIRPCLHSPLEIPVKGLDREGMRAAFERAVRMKPERHAGLAEESEAGRSMNRIGG